MKLDFFDIERLYKKRGYKFYKDSPFNVNIYGVRSKDRRPNEFNDIIGVTYQDDFLNHVNLTFKGTTDPGASWLKERLGNPGGTFILMPGQYSRVWKVGQHKGYEAMQQVGTFRGWRDSNKDGELDMSGPTYTDVWGLNGHTTSFINEIDKVGLYSAGCQVIQSDLDFLVWLNVIKKSRDYYGNLFTYTLLDEALIIGET